MNSTRQAGFTILEIMLSVFILVVGLLGILALFPVAIDSGKKSIENTTAIVISQSVEQAIREGLQHRKGQSKDGRWTYFLLQHDGVEDDIPRTVSGAQSSADYFILLPEVDSAQKAKAMSRVEAYASSKVFVYPETDGREWTAEFIDGNTMDMEDLSGAPPNGRGDAAKADDDSDDDENDGIRVLDTYELGDSLNPTDIDTDMLRDEEREAILTLQDYSFAFTIRRAFNDASLGRHQVVSWPEVASTGKQDYQIVPGNELFEVNVLVYRSFRPNQRNEPVLQSRFLVHK